MIFHLSAAGVPVSWSIVAAYRHSYGIAIAAADGWHAQSRLDDGGDEPQYVCEIAEQPDGGCVVIRDRLWMSERHLRRQASNDAPHLVQTQTAPMPLPAQLGSMLTKALRARLCAFGYLIPRADWERRYPAQALTSARFRAFREAVDAWRASDTDMGARMPFEPRWIPFMDVPADHVPPFAREGDHIVERQADGETQRIDAPDLDRLGPDKLDAAVRLLNSGWTTAEAAVLLTPEPVET